MKKIEILGTGCPKCKKLTEMTMEAASQLNMECNIEKVEDIQKIMAYGVMITPALVVDGEIRIGGKVPRVDEIKRILLQDNSGSGL
jgi:small redox-active disulfide protein 2